MSLKELNSVSCKRNKIRQFEPDLSPDRHSFDRFWSGLPAQNRRGSRKLIFRLHSEDKNTLGIALNMTHYIALNSL